MAFTDITSTASVRAVLGVSEKELRDDVLLDPIYSVQVQEALFDVGPDLLGDFVDTISLDPKTKQQQRFCDLAQTYSAYYIASLCLSSVAMFAPQTIKDSKSELTRNGDPYASLRRDIPTMLNILRGRLASAYTEINPAAPAAGVTPRINVLAAPLGVNPITG